jgi:hypothetical protein
MATKYRLRYKAPISKHQIPNNIEASISNDRTRFVLEFDHLVIGNYLEFGIWILGFHRLFGPGYTRSVLSAARFAGLLIAG